MIKVWTDGAEAGVLDKYGPRGSTFSYFPSIEPARAVSVTMPIRVASWNVDFGLAPIFEMNLPEGALRERLRLAFAKATGSFDDFDLLSIVGRSGVGRIRYTGRADQLDEGVPFQSVDEILASRRDGDLFNHLLEKFAAFSGVSGVQPKVLVRDETSSTSLGVDKTRLSASFRGATHIVKFWEPAEYPHLAANEWFCLKAAERCGLKVPTSRLAMDATALVIDRFDLRPDGSYCGFEDFCVLNARRTDQKYMGSYETSIMKRFQEFAGTTDVSDDLERLFSLIALNCAIRNGDAHLKNFGIVYDDVTGIARLAPAYDLVTTVIYLQADKMALTLNGTTHWPSTEQLQKFGEIRTGVGPKRIKNIMERIADALADTIKDIIAYANNLPEFNPIAERLAQSWEDGIRSSLKPVSVIGSASTVPQQN
jgi:serine/threonine-protein kinase HipA